MEKSRGEWEGAALKSRGFAARIGGSAAIASSWPRTRYNIPPATQAMFSWLWPHNQENIASSESHCSANAEATGSNTVEAPKNSFSGYFAIT